MANRTQRKVHEHLSKFRSKQFPCHPNVKRIVSPRNSAQTSLRGRVIIWLMGGRAPLQIGSGAYSWDVLWNKKVKYVYISLLTTQSWTVSANWKSQGAWERSRWLVHPGEYFGFIFFKCIDYLRWFIMMAAFNTIRRSPTWSLLLWPYYSFLFATIHIRNWSSWLSWGFRETFTSRLCSGWASWISTQKEVIAGLYR